MLKNRERTCLQLHKTSSRVSDITALPETGLQGVAIRGLVTLTSCCGPPPHLTLLCHVENNSELQPHDASHYTIDYKKLMDMLTCTASCFGTAAHTMLLTPNL